MALREFCFYDERQTHFRSNMLVALMPVMRTRPRSPSAPSPIAVMFTSFQLPIPMKRTGWMVGRLPQTVKTRPERSGPIEPMLHSTSTGQTTCSWLTELAFGASDRQHEA